jgi:hypothetical protein
MTRSGYRLGLSILGRDPERGVGPFRHNDPTQRPAEIYGGDVTVYSGGDRASYLLVPVIHGPFGKIKIFLPNGPWRVHRGHGASRRRDI